MTKQRILVVEDQPFLAGMIATHLEGFGYEPLGPCDCGETAIRLSGELRPDLVLMDVNLLGELDGVAVAEAIRVQFGIRSVLITAMGIAEVLPRAERASPVGFLNKPFTPTALQTTIEMALHLRDVQRQLQRNQQTLEAMLQTATDGLMVTDLQGRVLEANEAACRMTGLEHTQLIQRAVAPLFTGNAVARGALEESLSARTPYFTQAWVGPGGRQIEITFRSHHEERASDRYVCFMRDVTEHRQAAEALRSSERRLRLAVDAGGLGAFEHLVAEKRFLISPKFCEVVGLPLQSSFTQDDWTVRIHPDDRPRVSFLVERMLHDHTELDVEYRCCPPNGDIRWIRVMASPCVEHGRVERVHGVVQNITKRKEAESGFRQLSRAVEQSPVSVVITDLRGNIEYVNPQFCAASGYTVAEVKGKNPRVLKSGEMPLENYRQMWATITAGEKWQGEFHNRRKDGSLYWELASISPIRDELDNITHFVAVKEDITRQKQTARDLELRQSYLTAIIENQPDPVWLKDNDGRCLAVNRAYVERCGRESAAEFIGANLSDLWPAEFSAMLNGLNRQVREQGSTRFSTEVPLPDGARRWAEVYAGTARDSAGAMIGIVGCARDITDERAAAIRLLASARALEESNARLQAALARQSELAHDAMVANRAKSAFLASMSHELRTPLNVINGVSATMLREVPGTETAESAGLILECGEHLLGIIQEILDYTVVQGGHATLDVKPFDPRELVAAVLRQIAVPARQKSLAVICEISNCAPAAIESDPRRLQQILLNLLQNAVKFTERGGIHLTVSARPLGDGAWRWSFSVADSGIGISHEHLGKLFQPFAQATAEISRTHGGTGLGLAISRSFAQLMGGDVVVRSQPGRGSCFRCSIVARATELSRVVPAALAAADRPAPKTQPDVLLSDRIPLRILAADDIRTNREVLRRISAHFGYSPDLCVNGVEVLAALAQRMYDLVLLDVQMPVMDGLTAAREINRLYPDANRRPKLIAITANALPGDREKCLDAGMDDYLAKPLLPEHLEACILHWFAGAPKAPAPVACSLDKTELPLVDHAHLAAAFPDLSGPVLADVLSQLQAAALTDYRAALARLTESCARRDSDATATELHALKGCFLTIGWKRMAARCAETLQAVRAGKFSAWASLPGELGALCGESSTAMAAHLARLAEPTLVETSASP